MFSLSMFGFLVGCSSDINTKSFNNDPIITITSHDANINAFEGETISFRGQASDSNHPNDELEVAWYHGDTLVCDWSMPAESGESVCDIQIGGNDVNIIAEVRDIQNAAGRAEVQVMVTPTEAPEATIIAPLDSRQYYSDLLVNFEAFVQDAEDNATDLQIEWESSIDGILAVEAIADSNGNTQGASYLTEGEHFIQLHVTDTTGKSVSENVTIQVGGENNAPDCELLTPEDESSISAGEMVYFRGFASDSDIPNEDLIVRWLSDKDGELGSGSINSSGEIYFAFDQLSVNTHAITLEVSDEVGATCSDTIFFSVGTPPDLLITSPMLGDLYDVNDNILFQATVNGNTQNPDQIDMSWVSDIDGEFSTQSSDSSGNISFSTAALSAGMHNLIVTATDINDLTTSVSLNIHVNTPPTIPDININPDPATTSDNLVAIASGSSDADGENVNYNYQWYLNGSLTTNTTTNVPSSDTAKGDYWIVRATPNDGYSDGNYNEASIIISNSPPLINGVLISPTSPSTSDTVTCTATASDADGETLTETYIWSNLTTGTMLGMGDTLTLNTATSNPGDVLQCEVTFSDSDESTIGNAMTTIANSAPTLSNVLIQGDQPMIGNTLTCTYTANDADNEPLTVNYTWTNTTTGSNIGSDADLLLTSSNSSPTDNIECSVTVTDTFGDSATTSDTTTVINQAPEITDLNLSAETIPNTESISCLATVVDADGETPTVTYTWTNDTQGTTLGSDLLLTLDPSLAEVDDIITCAVLATDSYGGNDSGSISFTVENTAPSFIASATITPDTGVTSNTTLTCAAIAVDNDGSLPTLSYAWTNTSTGANLGSQDTLTLSNGTASPGDIIDCTVTATDTDGETAVSSDSVTVENSLPTITSMNISPQTLYTNNTITATAVASDGDGHPVSLSFEWQVNGTVVQSGSTNTLDGNIYFDKGDTISVAITPFDGYDNGSSLGDTLTCINSPPEPPTLTLTPSNPIELIDDLNCTISALSNDADGDTVSYGFSWLVNGVPFSGSSNSANSSTVPASATSSGEIWVCMVTPHDGSEFGNVATSTVTIESDWDGARTFTNCGQTGANGPSQSQCNSSYSGTPLDGEVSLSNGIQYWVVPADGTYIIEAYGASGGGTSPGNGAIMQGEFTLIQGDTLKIIVGQQGTAESYSRAYTSGAGGGGSFISDNSNNPIIVAGGGGGCGADSPGLGAITAQTGATGSSGQGGTCTIGTCEGNYGAGFYGNGGLGAHNSGGPASSFVNGGVGGTGVSYGGTGYGGFGGGGGDGYADGGGGGGYSGGNTFSDGDGGAGGGSYNFGNNQNNSAGSNSGHGLVIIDKL